MTRLPTSSALAVGLCLLLGAATADARDLKVATLAPQGSSWMKLFNGMNAELKKATGGKVAFKFYPGGVSGDEKDVVRKMRINQLHGAALTAVGLGAIQRSVLGLQLPLLFRSYAELDHVRSAMQGQFEKLFADKGYVILGWGDVGYTYIMSNSPVKTLADLRNVKMWAWVDDPIGKKVFETAGITPIPLSVPDVLPSLQTGLIDAVYTSPLAAIALQWNTKVTHLSPMPLAIGIGATILSKKQFDKLSPEQQRILMEISRKWHAKLIDQIRKDNKTAARKLVKQGMTVIKVGKAERKEWEVLSAKVRKALAGKLYSPALLKEIEAHLASYRSGRK